MKIGFIRYPQYLYENGIVIRGGSEIANQYIIDYLRSKKIEVMEFEPKNLARIELIKIPAIGTPLMFQDLLNQIDEINSCDVVFTTNWFGSILPEIKKPVITIFHHDAQLVLRYSNNKVIDNKEIFGKWLTKAQSHSLWQETKQTLHDQIISIEESYMAKNSARNVVVSEFLNQNLINDYNLDCEKNKIIFNSYPADWSKEKVQKDFSGKLKVICLTRLPIDYAGAIVKGLDRLFEIFSKEINAEKILVASTKAGVYEDFIEENLPDCQYVENANRDDVKDNLALAQISIHCSRCESFGLSIVESMLLKNVPIVYETGIAKEFIRNGENGFIVKDEKELLAVIKKLDANRALLEKVSQAAYESVIEAMSPEIIGEQYLELIKEVI